MEKAFLLALSYWQVKTDLQQAISGAKEDQIKPSRWLT
jgi:hypothetical protein